MFVPIGFTKEDIPQRGLVFHVDFNDLASYANNGNYIRSIGKDRILGNVTGSALATSSLSTGTYLANESSGSIYFESGSFIPNINGDEMSISTIFRYVNAPVTDDRGVLVSKEGCYELSLSNITGKIQHYIYTENDKTPYHSQKYYIPSTGTYNICGFEDNTKVYINGTLSTTLSLSRSLTTIILTEGDVVTSSRPISFLKSGQGVQPAFSSWAGTEFVWLVQRTTNAVFIAAVEGPSVVDIYKNGAYSGSVTLNQDEYYKFQEATFPTNIKVIASKPVCITQTMDGASGDNASIPPVGKEWYGWNSQNTFLMTATGSSTLEVYENDSSNNTFSQLVLNLTNTGSYATITSNIPVGSYYNTPPGYISSSQENIFIETNADGDGFEQTSWVPKSAFATKFILPDNAEHIAFLSTGGEPLTVGIYDEFYALTAVLQSDDINLGGKGVSDYVSGVYTSLGPSTITYPGGTLFITNKPAYGIYDQNSSVGDESILPGAYKFYSTGSDVRDGFWHQVTVTKKGDREKIYIDGQLVGEFQTESGNIRTADNRITLGGSGGDENPTRRFLGHIGNVSIYNRALTNNEIQQTYNKLFSRYIKESIIDYSVPGVILGRPPGTPISGYAFLLDAHLTSSLYPPSKQIWYDSGGATVDNHATFNSFNSQDADNQQWTFNGSNQFANILNDELINSSLFDYPLKTLSAWVNVKRSPTDQEDVIYEQGGTLNGISIYTYSGSLWTGIWSDSANWNSYTHPDINGVFHSGSINIDQWYHIFIGLKPSGSVYKVYSYLNGEEIGATEVPSPLYRAHVGEIGIGYNKDGARGHVVGNWPTTPGLYFSGSISFLKQTNSTFTQLDAIEEFNQYSASYGY
jgi:hypothetical protein